MLWENVWQVFSLVVPLSIKALCRGSFARQSSIFCSVVLSCSQDSLSVFQTPRIIKSAGEMGWLFLLCLFPSLSTSIPIHLSASQHPGVQYSVEQKPQMRDFKQQQQQ